MKLSVRIKTSGLRRKIQAVRGAVPREAERQLRALADQAVKLVESAAIGQKQAFLQRAIDRQMKSIFIPVTLKHVRRERWPSLAPIYQARIVQNQRTYQGRKRFWVDASKEKALRDELMRRALARHGQANYEVRFVATWDRRYRVEIVKRRGGRISRRDLAVMIAYARQNMKVVSNDTLRRALSAGGLR